MKPKKAYGAVRALARRLIAGDFGHASAKEVAYAHGTTHDSLRCAVMHVKRKVGKIEIIITKRKFDQVRAIVKARGWFPEGKVSPLYGDFYVVATWTQYEGFPKRKDWEAQMTIAMCARLEDAKIIFRRRK